jgi:hypothetical protein
MIQTAHPLILRNRLRNNQWERKIKKMARTPLRGSARGAHPARAEVAFFLFFFPIDCYEAHFLPPRAQFFDVSEEGRKEDFCWNSGVKKMAMNDSI